MVSVNADPVQFGYWMYSLAKYSRPPEPGT